MTYHRGANGQFRPLEGPGTHRSMLERIRDFSGFDTTGDEETISSVSLTQIAWQKLRADIICGKLRPKARLRIGKLREIYGIGASPLREALSRLVPDGFVVSLDRRGFMVAPVSLREFRELTDLRKLLENEAAKLALANGDDVWESQVVASLHRVSKLQTRSAGKMSQTMKEWETLNEAFQEALFSGCQSIWLLNFRRTVYFYAKRYLRVCLPAAAIRELHKDHRAMTDAAMARDATRLRSLIEDQLERIYRKVEQSGKL
jgi:GntR family transcriptional regulator, carbon starvation induced regulator